MVLLAPFDFILPIPVNRVAKRRNKLYSFLGGVPSFFTILAQANILKYSFAW